MKTPILLVLAVMFTGSIVIGCGSNGDPDMDYFMIEAYSKLHSKDYLRAVTSAERGISNHADNVNIPQFHEIKGEALFHLEKYTESKLAFERALACPKRAGYPVDEAKYHLFSGKLFLLAEMKVDAKREFMRCLEVADKESAEYMEASETLENLK